MSKLTLKDILSLLGNSFHSEESYYKDFVTIKFDSNDIFSKWQTKFLIYLKEVYVNKNDKIKSTDILLNFASNFSDMLEFDTKSETEVVERLYIINDYINKITNFLNIVFKDSEYYTNVMKSIISMQSYYFKYFTSIVEVGGIRIRVFDFQYKYIDYYFQYNLADDCKLTYLLQLQWYVNSYHFYHNTANKDFLIKYCEDKIKELYDFERLQVIKDNLSYKKSLKTNFNYKRLYNILSDHLSLTNDYDDFMRVIRSSGNLQFEVNKLKRNPKTLRLIERIIMDLCSIGVFNKDKIKVNNSNKFNNGYQDLESFEEQQFYSALSVQINQGLYFF